MRNFKQVISYGLGGLLFYGYVLVGCGPSQLVKVSRSATLPDPADQRVLLLSSFEASVDAIVQTQNEALTGAEQELDQIQQFSGQNPTFADGFGALDQLDHNFMRAWNRLYLLTFVSPDESLRRAAETAILSFESWYVDSITLNRNLYLHFKRQAAQLDQKLLSPEQKRYIEILINDYETAGMGLSDDQRQILKDKTVALSELTTHISTHINEAEGTIPLRAEELKGLSSDQLSRIPWDEQLQTYLLPTSDSNLYRLVETYAQSSELRKKVMRARYQRAQEDNGEMIVDVIRLRFEMAQLLGYKTWADAQTSNKMAGTGAKAKAFVDELNTSIEPRFEAEKTQLVQLKARELGASDPQSVRLNLEDVDYYINQFVQANFQVDQESVRPYFPEDSTLSGLFSVLGQSFGVDWQEDLDAPRWASDVRFFKVLDRFSGRVLGGLYLDLHPRVGKYKHFAEFGLVDGRRLDDSHYIAPVCAIVGNFPAPQEGGPSLWSYDDVETMVHEMGHALQHILTEANLMSFAGTNVPQDYVEVGSQTLERWIQDPQVMQTVSKHYQTGEALPAEMLARIVQAKKATVGHFYRRQLTFALSDLRIHMYQGANELPIDADAVYRATNQDYSQYYLVDADTGFLASFEHLFGGYDAGYYGYAWADVISADAASVFRNSPQGFLDTKTGHRFRETIYAKGNSQPIEETLREFLGRPWNSEAFLEELGLTDQ